MLNYERAKTAADAREEIVRAAEKALHAARSASSYADKAARDAKEALNEAETYYKLLAKMVQEGKITP